MMKMKVKLISWTNKKPLELTSYCARTCYSSKIPKWGKLLDVENILWESGHHTTLEHFFVSFLIDGIAVGDVTLGLHLVHPFYNTSQRSGRYSAKMFWKPRWKETENYISNFWPEIKEEDRKEIMGYIRKGVNLFQENHPKITELSRKFLKKERPFISKDNLEKSAPKIAQEQARMFIPVIFPTALVHTMNLVSLAALQRVAWTPSMRAVVREMIELVLKKFPELKFVYQWNEERNQNWSPKLIAGKRKVLKEPKLKLLKVVNKLTEVKSPKENEIGPLDLLHFLPEMMENYFLEIVTEIEISLATMGQDQRHRTIRRSMPEITGNFYLPPLLQEAGLEKKAKEILDNWLSFKRKIPDTLWMILAPYGAMVRYKKIGSLNAIIHEQSKRLCWRAQEEIYYLSCLLREKLKKKNQDLLKFLEPPCVNGKCPEGAGYCGRDLKLVSNDFNNFRRKV